MTAPRYSDELTWVTDGSEPEEEGVRYWVQWTESDDPAIGEFDVGEWSDSSGAWHPDPHAWAGPLLPPPPPVPRRAPGYWWARRKGGPGLEVVRVDEDGTWADTAGNSWGDDPRDAALWTCWSRAVPPVGVATPDSR